MNLRARESRATGGAAHPSGSQHGRRWYINCGSMLAEGVILQNNSLQCPPQPVICLATGIADDFCFWVPAVPSPTSPPRANQAMSVLGPISDMNRCGRHVRFGPKADILRCSKERHYSITSSAMVRLFSEQAFKNLARPSLEPTTRLRSSKAQNVPRLPQFRNRLARNYARSIPQLC